MDNLMKYTLEDNCYSDAEYPESVKQNIDYVLRYLAYYDFSGHSVDHDIEILRDENGERLPMEICKFDGLPIFNDKWNPQEYMAQHISMAFDDSKVIRLKVSKTDDIRYTIWKDWFGDEWEITKEKCDSDHVIVKVKTSPYMIVHWAMQYGDKFEVLNEDIREKIREEIKMMEGMYGNK